MKNLITICTIFVHHFPFWQNYIYDQTSLVLHLKLLPPSLKIQVLMVKSSDTWNGRLTAGLAITEQSFDNVDTKATILSPNISYLFLKKTVGENLLYIGINCYSTASYSDLNNLKSNAFDIDLELQ